MIALLKQLRKKAVIGFVGGSDLAKISEQLAVDGKPGEWPCRIGGRANDLYQKF